MIFKKVLNKNIKLSITMWNTLVQFGSVIFLSFFNTINSYRKIIQFVHNIFWNAHKSTKNVLMAFLYIFLKLFFKKVAVYFLILTHNYKLTNNLIKSFALIENYLLNRLFICESIKLNKLLILYSFLNKVEFNNFLLVLKAQL